MTRKQRLYLLLACAFTATLAIGIAATAGVMVAGIVSGSMAAGLVGWSRTSLKRPTDPARIVPVYLLTVFLLYLHIGEEFLYDFGSRIGALTGTGWTETQHMLQFGFIVPAFWILAAGGPLQAPPPRWLHGLVHLRGNVCR
jgi:ABC-type dipeptide/oligopeptide/nickel transport system permease subunit